MKRWAGAQAQRLTRIVLLRDGYRCAWCGGTADSADHLIPRARGGSDALTNLVACCLTCNKSKGTNPRPRRLVNAPPSRNW